MGIHDDGPSVTNVNSGTFTGSHFGIGNVTNISSAPSPPSTSSSASPPPLYPGPVKREVCDRLLDDWRALADVLEIPPADRSRFPQGYEPQAVWNWLEQRGRLNEFRGALTTIDRHDIADLLKEVDKD